MVTLRNSGSGILLLALLVAPLAATLAGGTLLVSCVLGNRVNENLTGPSAWWCFGRDIRHTRRSHITGAQTNNLMWSYTTGGNIFAPPAIGADGTLYVGSDDGKLYAFGD